MMGIGGFKDSKNCHLFNGISLDQTVQPFLNPELACGVPKESVDSKFEHEVVEELARLVEQQLAERGEFEADGSPIKFNAALVHLYRNGKDHIGWHHDREADDTFVVGISFGGERKFKIRRRGHKKGWLWEAMVANGSCLMMRPGMQRQCEHMIAKTNAKKQPPPRISVTLRQKCNSRYLDPNARTKHK